MQSIDPTHELVATFEGTRWDVWAAGSKPDTVWLCRDAGGRVEHREVPRSACRFASGPEPADEPSLFDEVLPC